MAKLNAYGPSLIVLGTAAMLLVAGPSVVRHLTYHQTKTRVQMEVRSTMLLIEATPNEVSQRIVEQTSIPVIGCGAGAACHGQIVVLQDLLGLSEWQPSFAKPITCLGEPIMAAARRWIEKVRASDLGPHPYRMSEEERDKL